MIFQLGCELRIVDLAQVLCRMQVSDKFQEFVFRICAGRYGGVCVEDASGTVLVTLQKGLLDSWPFVPDHTLQQLHTDSKVCKRWGLDKHVLTCFKVVDAENRSPMEWDRICNIVQHIQLGAAFSAIRAHARENATKCDTRGQNVGMEWLPSANAGGLATCEPI